jgi:hypothetical protein
MPSPEICGCCNFREICPAMQQAARTEKGEF